MGDPTHAHSHRDGVVETGHTPIDLTPTRVLAPLHAVEEELAAGQTPVQHHRQGGAPATAPTPTPTPQEGQTLTLARGRRLPKAPAGLHTPAPLAGLQTVSLVLHHHAGIARHLIAPRLVGDGRPLSTPDRLRRVGTAVLLLTTRDRPLRVAALAPTPQAQDLLHHPEVGRGLEQALPNARDRMLALARRRGSERSGELAVEPLLRLGCNDVFGKGN